MYFDAVLNQDCDVLYNDTPEKIKAVLTNVPKSERSGLTVVVGRTMQQKTVEEYLN